MFSFKQSKPNLSLNQNLYSTLQTFLKLLYSIITNSHHPLKISLFQRYAQMKIYINLINTLVLIIAKEL